MAPAPADELSIAERIDLQCDRFEAEFASDKRPRLEEFLGDVAESVRLPLFRGLLELELELRRRAGELPQRDDYAKRFEPYASIVDLVFAELNAGPSRRFSARSAARDSSVKGTAADTSQGPSRPAPAEPSPPLTQVARFLIEKRLGEGAFGAVYKARDPQLDRDVALKVPHAGALSSKDDRERFLREARAAAGLHHANICPVHEVGTTSDGRDYIVMAFIDGKPLSKVLQSGAKLTERQIASVVRKLAQALDEAHQKGVIHRDLKPANIMINRKGEPVIMDFGLARRASPSDPQLSHSGQIMGTPAYMSPEQARGDTKTVGPATDVYSLGIVLYEMLCGQRPFSGTVTEVIGSILHVEAPPPSQFREGIDPKLQAICMKAIAKKPADRYASMKDFAAALTDFIKAGATASAAPASAASSEPLVTNEFARLMEAVSADVESKVNRAVRSVARQHRTPTWWTYLAGSGVVGVIVLLGILFFIRKDTVTVIVNIPIDVNDPSLSFFLDKTSIGADALSAPIELKPGEHELVVNRDQQLFKRFVFSVGKGESGEVKVQDVTPTSAPESPMPTRDEDWVDLFNGRDLAGWQGNPAHWSVVNGVLIGKTPNQPLASFSYLCTPSSYRDFELKLRVKLLPGGNSGVQIRSRRSDPANFDVLGPQVEFVDARELIWGTLIEVPSANRPTYRPTYRANVDAVQAALKPGEFNDLLVTCQGRHVTVRLNGTLVNDVDYPDMSETGIIALQLHKAKPMEVQFQEISLRQLKTVSPPADAKTFQGHAYKFYPEQLSWKAAKARCEGLGGHLVIVESEAENGFVAGLVADANRDDCWIGATDEASEGQWRWVDGRPLTWTNWFTRQNQPNNKPPGEDYALMSNKRLAVDGLIGWEWSDQPNQALPAHKPGYLCEWDATPNSQATALGADLDDLARWQGKWRCIAENTQGHNATLEEVAERNHTMLIEGTRRSVERMINGKIQPYSGRFRINPAAVPQEFDFDFDDLKVAGGQRGLYEFDGSGLRLIYRGSNTEKPARANWSDKGQSNVSWFEFERVDDGWTDLFNGKDLTGWQGRQDLWTLRDGVLTGQAGSSDTNSFLFSPRPYADFELQFQVRIGANDNSGVQIRSEILDRNQWTARGQQCDIGNRPGDFWGGIYGENLPGGWLLKPGSAPAVKSGDWNDYSLRCVGRRVTIQVNGATTVDGDVAEMKDAGLLAFQIHRENQRPVEFRSIRIRLANLAATNSLDPDRKAAEWVLGIGGRVRVAAGESVSPWILPGGSLPDSAFQLHSVFTADDGKPWKESELRVLSGLAGLRAINFEQPISHTDATMEIVETLTGLESLRFEDSNEMTDAGLRRLAALTNLRALGLVSSRMTDATLEVLARLPQLDDLSLGITGYGSDPGKAAPLVTADGLAHLKKADKLSSLNLYGVPVDDAGLQRIGECRQVRSLKLGGSSVSDAGLQHLAGMTQLTTLRLRLTAVTDAGLVHLQGLQNLETLDLEGSPVTGRGTEHLRGLEKLRGLCLSASPVDDAGLEQIKSLTQLTLLDVRGSKVTDAGVPHLVGLAERLEVLHLIGTAITDASVPHLAKLSNLKSLNLDGSQITPAGLGRLRKALPQCNISPAPSNPQ